FTVHGTTQNGVYVNNANVTGTGGNTFDTTTDPGLSAPDSSTYTGVTVSNDSIAVDKLVSVDGGKTFVDSAPATGQPTFLSGFDNPQFEYTLTNNGPLAITAQTLVDDNGTPGNTADDFSTTQANGAGSIIVQVMGQDNTAGEGDHLHNIGDVNNN